jgi:hypothetical protein
VLVLVLVMPLLAPVLVLPLLQCNFRGCVGVSVWCKKEYRSTQTENKLT